MKRNLTHILYLTFILLLSACSDSNEPTQSQENDIVNMRLNIVLPDVATSPSTRGDEVDNDNYFELPVTEYEKVNNLRIIIVDGSGKVEHNRKLYFSEAVSEASAVFKVKKLEKKRVYLFANELNTDWQGRGYYKFSDLIPGIEFPTSEINALIVKAEEKILFDNTGTVKSFIPINEQFDITLTADQPGTLENPSEEFNLFITRAAVKFTFNATYEGNLSNVNSKLRINEIRIDAVGNQEYLLPNSTLYHPKKEVESDNPYMGRFITEYNVPDNGTVNSIISFFPDFVFPSEKTKQTYSPELYFAESVIGKTDGMKIQIVTGSPDKNEIFESSWEKLPNLSSLPRNTHVIVNLTVKEQEITCSIKVVPYVEINLSPDFGQFGPDNDSPIISWPTNNYESI